MCSLAAGVESLQTSEVFDQADDLHPLVQSALFGKVPKAIVGHVSMFRTEHDDAASVGLEDTQHQPERGRFARAVGSNETVDRAFRNSQVQSIDCDLAAKRLCHA